jgi:hypothetical protein
VTKSEEEYKNEDGDGLPSPTPEGWSYVVSDDTSSSEPGSLGAIDSSGMEDMFFVGYNPGLWDFSALEALSLPGDTSFLSETGNQFAPYSSAYGAGGQQQYFGPESFPQSFAPPVEEQQ